jgi:hypothetical protein
MPKPFHELTPDEFSELVQLFDFTRQVDAVHVHHTWRPNHADFASRPPLASIEGMFTFHTQVNGWSDIGQHVTIDPRGIVWTGRDWNVAPASAKGFNGNEAVGPFMFEMIGDFDTGRDPFGGAQKATAIAVIVALLKRFGLTEDAVRFHRQMSTKTCPGSAIDRAAFLDDVRQARLAVAPPDETGAGTASGIASADTTAETITETTARGVRGLRSRSQSIIADWEIRSRAAAPARESGHEEPREETMNANDVGVISGAEAPAAVATRAVFGRGAGFTPEEKQTLRPHVIDLRLGLLSEGGAFETPRADVERIFNELLPEELALREREGQPLRVLFYAHGGLTEEEEGIRAALRRLPFWRQNGIYPIFFCWETGLKETVGDLLGSLIGGQRDLATTAAAAGDELLEFVAGPAGRQVWSQMRRSAELSSLQGGGARLVGELTRDFWADHHAKMELHAIGHSAGAIFHSYFLPMLLDLKTGAGVPALAVESLHLLAPACTTALFESKLLSRVGPAKAIRSHTMYTMNKDLEQADTAGPYRKSLLYFVSRAFEESRPAAILGLEESLRDDQALIRFYGLSRTVPGVAQILFSKTKPDAPPDSATESTSHGDFDNEVKTMNSVARRILKRPDGAIVSFVDETSRNEVSRALAFPPAALAAAAGAGAAAGAAPGFGAGTGGVSAPFASRVSQGLAPGVAAGARKALCIGIDAYPAPDALAGCVNDARDWAAALAPLGFDVSLLLNQQATRDAMLASIRQMIGTAQPGDVLVVQYAGHGTQVPDLDGEETEGQDEALVPIDFSSGAFLIDDDLRGVLGAIPDGVNVTFFMDCCHSGTNTRMFGATPGTRRDGSRPRFLPMTPELAAAHVAMRSRSARAFAAPPPPRTPDGMREINFAACRADQIAFETNGAGDFTRRALAILRAGIGGLSNEAFQQRVIEAFGAGARQEPFLDCAPSANKRPLLGALVATLADGASASAPGPGATASLSLPLAASPLATADARLLDRLDAIERRLARLGA